MSLLTAFFDDFPILMPQKQYPFQLVNGCTNNHRCDAESPSPKKARKEEKEKPKYSFSKSEDGNAFVSKLTNLGSDFEEGDINVKWLWRHQGVLVVAEKRTSYSIHRREEFIALPDGGKRLDKEAATHHWARDEEGGCLTLEIPVQTTFRTSFRVHGFGPGDIKVKVSEGKVTMEAVRESKEGIFTTRNLRRSFKLPEDVDEAGLKCKWNEEKMEICFEAPFIDSGSKSLEEEKKETKMNDDSDIVVVKDVPEDE